MRKRNIHEIHVSFTLSAVIHIILGLLLIFMPDISRRLLCMLFGTGVSVYGLLNIVSYMLEKGESTYTPTLFLGICALALGVFSLFNPTFLIGFLFTIIALIVIIASVGGVRRALHLHRFGFIRWRVPLACSLITLLLALSVILFPSLYGNLLMMACGMLLTFGGICDLLSIHYLNEYL